MRYSDSILKYLMSELLPPHPHPAVNFLDSKPLVFRKFSQVFSNLNCKLSCRSQNKCLKSFPFLTSFNNHRTKSQSFPAASRAVSDNILSSKNKRNCLFLNFTRLFKPLLLYNFH